VATRETIPIPARPVSGTITSLPSGIQIVTTVWGDPEFFAADGLSAPSTSVNPLSISGLALPQIRSLSQIIFVCCTSAKFDAKIGAAIIASGYTRPGKSEALFAFAAPLELIATDTIEINIHFPAYALAGADYEIYVTVGDRTP